jgi:hypothetical protein
MSSSDSVHDLDDGLKADMSAALEWACSDLPPALDSYETRKYIASRLLALAAKGERRLTELTTAAKRALVELR